MPYALLLHSDQIFTSSISNIDLVRGTCLLTVSRLEVVSFPSNALLWSLSSETTWVVRASPGALGWKHVICGCCRVTSQKAFLSSVGVQFVVL